MKTEFSKRERYIYFIIRHILYFYKVVAIKFKELGNKSNNEASMWLKPNNIIQLIYYIFIRNIIHCTSSFTKLKKVTCKLSTVI